MHYRHSYHAGNFADVFKHVLLCGLLAALNRKDKPWCALDTHAGAGFYDLSGEGAMRTGEWQDGIGRLAGVQDAPEPLATYLRVVAAGNTPERVRYYPGSPQFLLSLAREQDRVQLCEKVPEVADDLRMNLGRDPRVALHLRDGYEAHALLPPKEKRGLILVDPPFERTDEYAAMAEFTRKAVARFAGGIVALWYPVKNRHAANGFLRRVGREVERPSLAFEIDNGAQAEGQMHACGVLVVNPPFQFEREMQPSLKLLERVLAQGPKPQCRFEWVRTEQG
ncbi:MAG: 23S rRNA (adenine(2030)-N(6))-methyltransferase RlmJ [Nevskiaceae bacterium]|nr:MAG: 23S rRNA (adenine(2030)-N(6))-methyltransferase RlmJ [Nevskiaceae bacterium]